MAVIGGLLRFGFVVALLNGMILTKERLFRNVGETITLQFVTRLACFNQ